MSGLSIGRIRFIREQANDQLTTIEKYDWSDDEKDAAMERVVIDMNDAIKGLGDE
jgi:ribosome recycling factor